MTGEEERLTPALFDSHTDPERDSDEDLRLRAEVERLETLVVEKHELIQGWARYGERVKADRARFGDMLIAALGLQHEPVSRHFHRLVPQACEEIARLRADIERLTAGADPAPAELGTVLTPGQWIARWNAATAEERLEQVRHLQGMANMAGRCFALDHEGRLGEEIPMLRREIERLRGLLAQHEDVQWGVQRADGVLDRMEDEDDAREHLNWFDAGTAEMVNRTVTYGPWLPAATGQVQRKNTSGPNVCHGCGSVWIVIRGRRAYCAEPTCDRRLPGPLCETCTLPRALHVCLSCSPDELTAGPGCGNCRNTGWNQTPCLPPVGAPTTKETSC